MSDENQDVKVVAGITFYRNPNDPCDWTTERTHRSPSQDGKQENRPEKFPYEVGQRVRLMNSPKGSDGENYIGQVGVVEQINSLLPKYADVGFENGASIVCDGGMVQPETAAVDEPKPETLPPPSHPAPKDSQQGEAEHTSTASSADRYWMEKISECFWTADDGTELREDTQLASVVQDIRQEGWNGHEHTLGMKIAALGREYRGNSWADGWNAAIERVSELPATLRSAAVPALPMDELYRLAIESRDAAEQALSQAYYLITGKSPHWSESFGHKEALEEIDDAQKLLRLSLANSATPEVRHAKGVKS